ncbi:hypothetical protein L6164_006799 [Bauhinia variegata]|uniref:Uncharacterized protein n=1 Tax=Bauhinia variegata TaxID=167791 RepID=A0ACB9PXN5_BAUVA|nr:hypothetical protein L6164_006799 [Bauhinia variegata]
MGYSRFLSILLLSSLLFLSFTHGFGRVLMKTVDNPPLTARAIEFAGKSRFMTEVMDYSDPEPNTNTKNGFMFSPPSPDSTPSPSPSSNPPQPQA